MAAGGGPHRTVLPLQRQRTAQVQGWPVVFRQHAVTATCGQVSKRKLYAAEIKNPQRIGTLSTDQGRLKTM